MAQFQPGTWSLVSTYYEDPREDEEELADYVFYFGIFWYNVHSLGVTDYDGIVRLIGQLPKLWREWAEATARHYLWRRHPSYDMDGDMRGFVQAMLNELLDHPEGPPAASTVAPPFDELKLPSWTFLGRQQREQRGRDFEEGESSQATTSKGGQKEDEGEPIDDGSRDRDDDEDPEEEDPEEENSDEEDTERDDSGEEDSNDEDSKGDVEDDPEIKEIDEDEPRLWVLCS